MPLYLLTVEEGRSTEPQRKQIGECIMNVHVDVTGAPRGFVNTYFREHADLEGGFRELPAGKVVFVNANIRAGRTAEAKAEITNRITEGIVDSLGCKSDEVELVFADAPAAHGMEGGTVLPEPGSPEEAAWRERGHG